MFSCFIRTCVSFCGYFTARQGDLTTTAKDDLGSDVPWPDMDWVAADLTKWARSICSYNKSWAISIVHHRWVKCRCMWKITRILLFRTTLSISLGGAKGPHMNLFRTQVRSPFPLVWFHVNGPVWSTAVVVWENLARAKWITCGGFRFRPDGCIVSQAWTLNIAPL